MSLYRQPVKVTQTLATRNQNGGVTGKRAALKLSQAYPPEFGKAVARIFALIRKRSSFDDLLDSDLCCGLEVMSKGTKRTNTKQRTEGKRTKRTSTTVKRTNTKQLAKRTKRTNTKCTNTKISESVLDFFLTLA
jgi:predicted transcriptional regulator